MWKSSADSVSFRVVDVIVGVSVVQLGSDGKDQIGEWSSGPGERPMMGTDKGPAELLFLPA